LKPGLALRRGKGEIVQKLICGMIFGLLLITNVAASADLWVGSVATTGEVYINGQRDYSLPVAVSSTPVVPIAPWPVAYYPPAGYFDHRYSIGGWHYFCWPFGYDRGFELPQ